MTWPHECTPHAVDGQFWAVKKPLGLMQLSEGHVYYSTICGKLWTPYGIEDTCFVGFTPDTAELLFHALVLPPWKHPPTDRGDIRVGNVYLARNGRLFFIAPGPPLGDPEYKEPQTFYARASWPIDYTDMTYAKLYQPGPKPVMPPDTTAYDHLLKDGEDLLHGAHGQGKARRDPSFPLQETVSRSRSRLFCRTGDPSDRRYASGARRSRVRACASARADSPLVPFALARCRASP